MAHLHMVDHFCTTKGLPSLYAPGEWLLLPAFGFLFRLYAETPN
jgi:hypothetical protein